MYIGYIITVVGLSCLYVFLYTCVKL